LSKYIYLDWNVFQHMKHEHIDEIKFINGVEFKKLIENLSLKYIFPYSEAHLRDLSISNTIRIYFKLIESVFFPKKQTQYNIRATRVALASILLFFERSPVPLFSHEAISFK